MKLKAVRDRYHQQVRSEIIRLKESKTAGTTYYNFADSGNKGSIVIADSIVRQIGGEGEDSDIAGQTAGRLFEILTKEFLEKAFSSLSHLRPGTWMYRSTQTEISQFAQYQHLAEVEAAISESEVLSSVLGREQDYMVTPDVVVLRTPIDDATIDAEEQVISDDNIALRTLLRAANHKGSAGVCDLLHATISCKWTIRSGRSQNVRTEALNLIRNRKGRVPHIVAVTAEPLPTRIASIALGTGDLDCVYHFALPELERAVEDEGNQDQNEMLRTLTRGDRLRDVSDLPFDLAV